MKLGCALTLAATLFVEPLLASEQTATTMIWIEGMTCEGCAFAVEVQLDQTEGVLGYAVSFADGEARVRYDPGKTTPEKIAAAIGLTGLPRFLAILSPSCGECAHGAQVVREALLQAGAAPKLDIFIVWAPMLPEDDQAAARASSALFDARVRQYYDPARRAGAAFRSDVYREAVSQMRRSLPQGHFLTQRFASRDPAQPEWDIYMFFGPDAEWTAQTPRPARFVRQVVLLDKRISVLWKNDYVQPPLEGSLVEELRKEAAALLER